MYVRIRGATEAHPIVVRYKMETIYGAIDEGVLDVTAEGIRSRRPTWEVGRREFLWRTTAVSSLDGRKRMHSKKVTFRPRVSIRHMHLAKQRTPNSRTISEG